MNSPLIQGTKIPTLEEIKATKLDNIKFKKENENATPEKIKELKAESLFSPKNGKSPEEQIKQQKIILEEEKSDLSFDDFSNGKKEFIKVGVDGKNEKSSENIGNKKNEKIEANPIFPVMQRLNTQGKISKETFIKITESLSENKKLELKKIEGIKPEEKLEIEGYITNLNEQNKNGNRLNLIKNIKEIEILEGEKTNDDGTFQSEVLNMIGGNYLQFPDKEGNFDTKKDLQTAILTTKNEILKKYTNFSRESESYKTAMKNIKSQDQTKQMQGIELLYILATSKPGKLQSNISKYRIKNKEKIEKKAKNKKQQLEEQIISENNPEKKEQIRQEWKEYQEKYKNELNENTKIGKDLKENEGVIKFGELDEIPESNDK